MNAYSNGFHLTMPRHLLANKDATKIPGADRATKNGSNTTK